MFWPRLTFAAALIFVATPLLAAGARNRRQLAQGEQGDEDPLQHRQEARPSAGVRTAATRHNLNGGSIIIGMGKGRPPPPLVLQVFVFERGGSR